MERDDPLVGLRTPEAGGSLHLRLSTRTPLYTGGIGQHGDQIHPSGLLGSIRHFSTAVAATLGDAHFEQRVWGGAGGAGGDPPPRAKAVALHWETLGLRAVDLPEKIHVETGGDRGDWYFNRAWEGTLGLRITRLGIDDGDWRLLRAALLIQARHAMFGAKDQFGLGVLDLENPEALGREPFTEADVHGLSIVSGVFMPLNRYVFWDLDHKDLSRLAARKGQRITRQDRLKAGLEVRAALRKALREPGGDGLPRERLTALRHCLLGQLGEWGSAVNVSAAWKRDDGRYGIRVTVALRPDDAQERQMVARRFKTVLMESSVPRATVFGPGMNDRRHDLLNRLAGWDTP